MTTWTCTACHLPIPDHDGYLIVDELKADLGEFQVWLPLHTACLPDPEVGYGIDVHRLRAAADFDWWDAHLSGKSWIDNTDWQDIYAAGGHRE